MTIRERVMQHLKGGATNFVPDDVVERIARSLDMIRDSLIPRYGYVERRIVGGNLRLGHHRHRLFVDAQTPEVVVEVLLQGVPDCPLRVGADGVERDLVDLVGRQLGSSKDEPHLRAVAVGNGHVPTLTDHPRDVPAGLARRDVLIADGLMLTVLDERVAADRDDGRSSHDVPYSTAPRTSARSAMRITTPLNASNQ